MNMKKLKVLSLFDGMSGGQVALEQLGYSSRLNNLEYYASEIKPYGIESTQHNYPETIQLGDVTKVSFKDGVLYSEKGEFKVGQFDMVIGGSPCQNFSILCLTEKRKGLEGEKSKLFYEFLRILKEVNPKYFFLENVASMKEQDRKELDEYLEVESIKFNSNLIGGAHRNRLYWTNIPQNDIEVTDNKWQDYILDGYVNKEKCPCLLEGHSRPTSDKLRLTRRYLDKSLIPVVFESKEHYEKVIEHYTNNYKGLSAKEVDAIRDGIDNSIYDKVRILSKEEMERLQGFPEGYTSSVSRNQSASLLGDGWHIPTIVHLMSGIIKEK